MFIKGPIDGVIIVPAVCREDHRGWLMELFRRDEIAADLFPQMGYVSQTLPQVVRGPHVHREQSDYFAFIGPGDFAVSLWDTRETSPTSGYNQRLIAGASHKCLIVVPPGIVHAYKNISDEPAWSFNFPNRLYGGEQRGSQVDEVRYEEVLGHQFLIDDE